MKITFKYLVNCFLSVFLFFSLFLFPVLAEESSTFEIINGNTLVFNGSMTTEQFNTIIVNSPYNLSNSIGFFGSVGQSYFFISDATQVTSDGRIFYNTMYVYSLSSSSWEVRSNSGIDIGISSAQILFNSLPRISGSDNFSNWNGRTYDEFLSLFDYTPPLDWSADFNESLSNPYISQLVGFALDNEVSSWYIEFSLFQTPFAPYGYTTTNLGYRYLYRLVDSSDDSVLSTVIFYEVPGQECSTSNSTCRIVTSYTAEIESEVVLKSSWLVVPDSGPLEVVDTSGNALLNSGNSSSQSASTSLNNTTSDFNNTASYLESFESQFNSGMTSALANIDISGGNLGNVSDFVSTANFVKLQFDSILDNSGIYKSVITFSLILGLALLLIGRRS